MLCSGGTGQRTVLFVLCRQHVLDCPRINATDLTVVWVISTVEQSSYCAIWGV